MYIEKVVLSIDGAEKTVGFIDHEQRCFTSSRQRSKHFHRKLNAWGVDADVLLQLGVRGVKDICIYDAENGLMYRTGLATFLERGIVRDFGHGSQRFLPLKYWQVEASHPE
ncbi:MAG: hypothetical protein AB1330_01640 [Bacillota bacterium]